MRAATTARPWTGLTGLEPLTHRPHSLHSPARTYIETNCYADILIELVHALGLQPLASMGATLRMDFEGDQWTFFKPFPEDLRLLYGIDIHEMQLYRPLEDHIHEQLERGRTLIVELDSFYLPDTAATSYRCEHVKSSVIAQAIDREHQRLRYFHGTGLHELDGEDYREVLRLARELPVDVLPPYTELVRFDEGVALADEQLRSAARSLTAAHLAARPARNPFVAFGDQLGEDLPRLLQGDSASYHAYAFATIRMAGSAFEVAASHVQWLLGDRAAVTVTAFQEIVAGCKSLSFRLARRRPFDPTETLQALSDAWDRGVTALDRDI